MIVLIIMLFLKKGRLVEYGAGEVRVKEVEGVQTLVIWKMN